MVTKIRKGRVKRTLATVLTGTLVATAAVLGSVSAAQAADSTVDAGSGTLAWGFKSSLRTYVGNQTAALPAQGGAAPIGTRIVPSAGATFDPASTPIPAQTNAQEKLPYLFPVSGGTVADANNLEVALGGDVRLWFPSHNFDIHFGDLKVKVAGGVGTLVGDLSFADVSWNGTSWDVAAPTVGNDIVIGTIGNVAVNLNAGAKTVSVSGTNVALTAAAAAVFENPVTGAIYSEGDPLDDFTVSASYTAAPVASTPSITVSKTTGLSKAGETIRVTGSGFSPNPPATTGTRPPLSGQFGGAYVVFGKFLNDWKPSAGAPSSSRTVITQHWGVSAAQFGGSVNAGNGGFVIADDGTFSIDIAVSASEANDLLAGNYGIYTYPGSGATYAPFETFTPLSFSTTGTGAAGDINVSVPGWVEPETGSFGWAFENQAPANLGVATQNGTNFVAAGALNEIVVTDTRAGGSGAYSWSLSGQVGNFSSGANSFSGSLLGWTPKVVSGGPSVAGGAAVTSSQLGGTGLGSSSVLGSSNAASNARLGADLSLVIPGTTPAGDYTAKLTITAVS